MYLAALRLPSLENDVCDSLALPIKAGELKEAIKGMASGKTPGPDGLLAEFYLAFVDILAPWLEHLYATALGNGGFHPTLERPWWSRYQKPRRSIQQ